MHTNTPHQAGIVAAAALFGGILLRTESLDDGGNKTKHRFGVTGTCIAKCFYCQAWSKYYIF